MKNGGKDFPDRWDGRNKKHRGVMGNCTTWGTEWELRLERSFYVDVMITNAMKKRLFSLAG